MERHKDLALRCGECAAEYRQEFVTKCRSCGGLVDPVYDLEHVRILAEGSSLERYFDLLPLEHSEFAAGGCQPTPLVHARTFGARHDLDALYLKNETTQPTKTTKDRMAACALSRFVELGIDEFVASSTGNSSTAFAHWIKRHGRGRLHAHLFSGTAWLNRHQHCDQDNVTLHRVDGTFVETGAAAKAYATEYGVTWEGGFFNPARREGLKLAYFEAFDALPRQPSVVIQAISSGMGLYGAANGVQQYRALGRLRVSPRLVAVQQTSCAPMVKTFRKGLTSVPPEYVVPRPTGIAEAILRGDPSASYPYMQRIVRRSGGTIVDIGQSEIESAQETLAEDEGLQACPASSAAAAAAVKLRRTGWLEAEDVVLVNLAGGTRSAGEVTAAIVETRGHAASAA